MTTKVLRKTKSTKAIVFISGTGVVNGTPNAAAEDSDKTACSVSERGDDPFANSPKMLAGCDDPSIFTTELPGYSLGFKPSNEVTLLDYIKEGIPVENIENLSRKFDIGASKLATMVNIPARTLSRRKKEGRFHADESDRLLRLGILYENAARVLGSPEQATRWLKTPKKALGGSTPLEFANTEYGAREVEGLIGRLEHGVFS